MPPEALLALVFFAVAVLYSSVGHAGASGYLAAMAFMGLAPEVMKPTALVLNILVATIATFAFSRAGHFSWRTLWPFALGSTPMAFIGGAFLLPTPLYKRVVGVVLLLSAMKLAHSAWKKRDAEPDEATPVPPLLLSILAGAVIGLLSGLTGTGGGIFLSPLLLFLGWAETKKTAGVSAAFILVNSMAGLSGNLLSVRSVPAAIPLWSIAAVAGGLLGAYLGSKKLDTKALRVLLAAVLLIAGGKLLLT